MWRLARSVPRDTVALDPRVRRSERGRRALSIHPTNPIRSCADRGRDAVGEDKIAGGNYWLAERKDTPMSYEPGSFGGMLRPARNASRWVCMIRLASTLPA